jgi:hypothetical protein
MRFSVFVLLLLGSSAAYSASFTIDFEELAPGPGAIPAPYFTDGFRFSPAGSQDFFANAEADGIGTLAYCPDCVLTMELTDMSSFDLFSFDYAAGGSGLLTNLTVTGNLAAGGTIQTIFNDVANITVMETYLLDSAWSGLQSVTFSADQEPGFGNWVDNIVVATVPVPAAVWLFGSALAGLGWMRRKQTV